MRRQLALSFQPAPHFGCPHVLRKQRPTPFENLVREAGGCLEHNIKLCIGSCIQHLADSSTVIINATVRVHDSSLSQEALQPDTGYRPDVDFGARPLAASQPVRGLLQPPNENFRISEPNFRTKK